MPLVQPGVVTSLDPFLVKLATDETGQPCQRVAPAEADQRGAVLTIGGARLWLGEYDPDDVASTVVQRVQEVSQQVLEAQQVANDTWEVADFASMTATTADGRVTVSPVNPTEADADGKPEGAIWEVRDGATALRRFMIVDGAWMQVRIGNDFVGENAIGDAQIVSLSVGKLDAGAALLDTAVVEKLWAEVVRSRLISTDMLLVGAGPNLLPWQPHLTTEPHTGAYGGALSRINDTDYGWCIRTQDATVTSGTYTSVMYAMSGSNATNGRPGDFNVTEGESYRLRVGVSAGGTYSNGTPRARLIFFWYDKDGAYMSSTWGASVSPSYSGPSTFVELQGDVPVGATSVRLSFQQNEPGLLMWYRATLNRMTDASLVVDGAIDGKIVTGATVRTAAGAERVEMDTERLARYRDDGEGGSVRTVNIGGATGEADELALYDANGNLMSGFLADGSARVQGEANVGSLRVGGDTLTSILEKNSSRLIAYHLGSGDSDVAGSAELGYVTSGNIAISASRMYRIAITGIIAAATAGDRVRVWLKTYDATNGTQYRQMGQAIIPTGTGDTIHVETTLRGWVNGVSSAYVTFQNATANRGVFWSGRSNYPTTFVVQDVGSADDVQVGSFNLQGGTPLSSGAVTNETGATAYVKTYSAEWVRSWRGGSLVTDYLHQGYYGGLQRYSMAAFPTQMITDLTGATITKVEIRLDNQSWWGSSGTAIIGRVLASAISGGAPASPQTSGGNPFSATGWAEGLDKWVTAPAGWWSTSYRGITLGEGAGTSTTNYGKFARTPVQMRISYLK